MSFMTYFDSSLPPGFLYILCILVVPLYYLWSPPWPSQAPFLVKHCIFLTSQPIMSEYEGKHPLIII